MTQVEAQLILVRQSRWIRRSAPNTITLQYIGGRIWAINEVGERRLVVNTEQGEDSEFIVVTAESTLVSSNETILANGTFSVFLPSVAANIGKKFTIKNIGAGTITLDGAGGELIEGEITQPLATGVSLTVISDGNNWWII